MPTAALSSFANEGLDFKVLSAFLSTFIGESLRAEAARFLSLMGDLDLFFDLSFFALALSFLGDFEGDFAFLAGDFDLAGVFLAFETDFFAADFKGVLPSDFAGD